MDDFLTWSGWLATIVATVIAVIQFFKKEKYKKQFIELRTKIENNNITATNKGVAIGKNKGDVNIH